MEKTMINPSALPDGSISENRLDAALKSVITKKQDVITDLDAIRAGAAKGATALQTHQSLAAYAKTADVDAALAEKQDVIEDLDVIRAGAAKGATALQTHQSLAAYAKTADVDAALANKQDALTLTVKDNGNIVLSSIQGQSKEFMPATPTGDPLHWAYVKRGAEYNDTGASIVKPAPWADLADDEADKTVVHKEAAGISTVLGI